MGLTTEAHAAVLAPTTAGMAAIAAETLTVIVVGVNGTPALEMLRVTV
jgi:hypothetical protein